MLQQLCGSYKMDDGSLMEFYVDEDLLFYKINGQIWGALSYAGDTTFKGMNTEAKFTWGEKGEAALHFEFLRRRQIKLNGKKVLNYG